MRCVVTVGSDRADCRGDQGGAVRLAFLDQASGGSYWIHRWSGLHVCTMQSVCTALETPQSIQPYHLSQGCSTRRPREYLIMAPLRYKYR